MTDRAETDRAAAARRYLLGERRDLLSRTLACADAVTADWDGDATAERQRVVKPLRATLSQAGVLSALPDVLRDCATAAGLRLPAPPVAAPPYVAVTSRGPVLRATADEGRLVVTVAAFDVERGPTPRYVRGAATPEAALTVEFVQK